MNETIFAYYSQLLESFQARDRGDLDGEDDLLGELDTLWLSMTAQEREWSGLAGKLALAWHKGDYASWVTVAAKNLTLATFLQRQRAPLEGHTVCWVSESLSLSPSPALHRKQLLPFERLVRSVSVSVGGSEPGQVIFESFPTGRASYAGGFGAMIGCA